MAGVLSCVSLGLGSGARAVQARRLGHVALAQPARSHAKPAASARSASAATMASLRTITCWRVGRMSGRTPRSGGVGWWAGSDDVEAFGADAVAADGAIEER